MWGISVYRNGTKLIIESAVQNWALYYFIENTHSISGQIEVSRRADRLVQRVYQALPGQSSEGRSQQEEACPFLQVPMF